MDWIVLHRNGSPVAVNINLIVTFFEPTFANVPFKTRLCFQAQDDYMDVDETCKEIWDMIKEREAVSHAG